MRTNINLTSTLNGTITTDATSSNLHYVSTSDDLQAKIDELSAIFTETGIWQFIEDFSGAIYTLSPGVSVNQHRSLAVSSSTGASQVFQGSMGECILMAKYASLADFTEYVNNTKSRYGL